MPQLTYLDICDCGISDLLPISSCTQLRSLRIRIFAYEQVSDKDAEALSRLSSLESLVISACPSDRGMHIICENLHKIRVLRFVRDLLYDPRFTESAFSHIPALSANLEELECPFVCGDINATLPLIGELRALKRLVLRNDIDLYGIAYLTEHLERLEELRKPDVYGAIGRVCLASGEMIAEEEDDDE